MTSTSRSGGGANSRQKALENQDLSFFLSCLSNLRAMLGCWPCWGDRVPPDSQGMLLPGAPTRTQQHLGLPWQATTASGRLKRNNSHRSGGGKSSLTLPSHGPESCDEERNPKEKFPAGRGQLSLLQGQQGHFTAWIFLPGACGSKYPPGAAGKSRDGAGNVSQGHLRGWKCHSSSGALLGWDKE